MKKLSVLSLVAAGLGLLLIHSCRKEQGNKPGSEIQNIANDDAMARRIISFKEKRAFPQDNPCLKNEGSISVDSAVLYIEAFMNLTYGKNDSASELVQKESNIAIHIDEHNMINNLEVAQLFEKVEDTMNMHLQSIGWQNKIIILVDLESFEDLTGLYISMTTLIGNTTFIGPPNKSWKFGELRGSCDGYYEGEKDAATECLEKEDEFPYYRDNYIDFCEALETETIKYQRSLFIGVDLGDIWQHKLSIWVGRRWISYHE